MGRAFRVAHPPGMPRLESGGELTELRGGLRLFHQVGRLPGPAMHRLRHRCVPTSNCVPELSRQHARMGASTDGRRGLLLYRQPAAMGSRPGGSERRLPRRFRSGPVRSVSSHRGGKSRCPSSSLGGRPAGQGPLRVPERLGPGPDVRAAWRVVRCPKSAGCPVRRANLPGRCMMKGSLCCSIVS